MTEDEKLKSRIREIAHEMDLAMKPFACYIHPEDFKIIEKDIKNQGLENYLFIPTEAQEKGKVVIIDRKELEKWIIGTPTPLK